MFQRILRCSSAFVVFTILCALSLAPHSTHAAEPPAPVDLDWGVKIPLRDGVRLNATVFRPAGQKEPLPVVFTLTPYTADSYLNRALYFARNGYVYALIDVRGRGNSEGAFEPIASPNSIFLEKNYNSGGVVLDETAKDARTAHITLYHDSEHPSAFEIPVVR